MIGHWFSHQTCWTRTSWKAIYSISNWISLPFISSHKYTQKMLYFPRRKRNYRLVRFFLSAHVICVSVRAKNHEKYRWQDCSDVCLLFRQTNLNYSIIIFFYFEKCYLAEWIIRLETKRDYNCSFAVPFSLSFPSQIWHSSTGWNPFNNKRYDNHSLQMIFIELILMGWIERPQVCSQCNTLLLLLREKERSRKRDREKNVSINDEWISCDVFLFDLRKFTRHGH